jgi:hypothetical protein
VRAAFWIDNFGEIYLYNFQYREALHTLKDNPLHPLAHHSGMSVRRGCDVRLLLEEVTFSVPGIHDQITGQCSI